MVNCLGKLRGDIVSSIVFEIRHQHTKDSHIFGSSDNWIAVGDSINEWATFDRPLGRLCKTHTQVAVANQFKPILTVPGKDFLAQSSAAKNKSQF